MELPIKDCKDPQHKNCFHPDRDDWRKRGNKRPLTGTFETLMSREDLRKFHRNRERFPYRGIRIRGCYIVGPRSPRRERVDV